MLIQPNVNQMLILSYCCMWLSKITSPVQNMKTSVYDTVYAMSAQGIL